MNGCGDSCCKCFKLATGEVVKQTQERTGAGGANEFAYYLANGNRTTTEPDMNGATQVDCTLYENQVQPSGHETEIFCEVDANGDATGVRVATVVTIDPLTNEPSVTRYNLSVDPIVEWTGDITTLAECGSDQQVEADPVEMCDEGTDFIRWFVMEKGEPTGVTYDTTLTGATHTASGNEVKGACNAQLKYDYESTCFTDGGTDPDISGQKQTVTNVTTGTVVAVNYIDEDGNVLDKTMYTPGGCC